MLPCCRRLPSTSAAVFACTAAMMCTQSDVVLISCSCVYLPYPDSSPDSSGTGCMALLLSHSDIFARLDNMQSFAETALFVITKTHMPQRVAEANMLLYISHIHLRWAQEAVGSSPGNSLRLPR